MTPALAPRRSSLEETLVRLEVAGLMRKPVQSHSTVHALLMPANLRVVKADKLPEYRRPGPRDPQPTEPDDYLQWDSLDAIGVEPSETWPALWQLLRMTKASVEAIEKFTARWGMLASDWDSNYGGGDLYWDEAGDLSIETWRSFAKVVASLVKLLVATATNELVDLETLRVVEHWADLPPIPEEAKDGMRAERDEKGRLKIDLPRLDWDRFLEVRWQTLLEDRREGKGIESQRQILINMLNGQLEHQTSYFVWDENGRRTEREAWGLDAIVYSHVASLFSSPDVDVLVCSICGTPYPFDETSSRRPRFGTRRYCSDECRSEGKRESNRQSWSRNSARWRRKATHEQARESPDGKA